MVCYIRNHLNHSLSVGHSVLTRVYTIHHRPEMDDSGGTGATWGREFTYVTGVGRHTDVNEISRTNHNRKS